MLAGCGKVLENYVRSTFGVKARSVELNVSQRCSGMIASLTDIEEAAHAGAIGVSNALNGATGMMVSMKRSSGSPYSLEYVLKEIPTILDHKPWNRHRPGIPGLCHSVDSGRTGPRYGSRTSGLPASLICSQRLNLDSSKKEL